MKMLVKKSIWRSGPSNEWVWLASFVDVKESEINKSFKNYCLPKWGYREVVLVEDNKPYPDNLLENDELEKYGSIICRKTKCQDNPFNG